MKNIAEMLRYEKQEGIKGGLYHQTQIIFAYNSNHIEGSTLTEDQTRYIYQTNSFLTEEDTVVKVDDVIETINHFEAFDYILDNVERLDEELIKQLHYILKKNTSDSKKEWFVVGGYKKLQNYIGGEKTAEPKEVERELQALLRKYSEKTTKTLEDIVKFHYQFEKIHPFQDGNGRVGRLIMFKECLRHSIVPFVIDESHKLFYYRGLKNFPEERGWLLDTCLSAQDKYKEKFSL